LHKNPESYRIVSFSGFFLCIEFLLIHVRLRFSTIASTGTLTLHVTENGTAGGTPIVGATFIRCDSGGTTYGTAITSDASGNAIFGQVPFAATGAPLIYYKQTGSDGDHEFNPALVNTTMTISTQTIEVTNTLAAQRTIALTDANYASLPIVSGSITLS